jgi:hypothetical protein
MTTTLTTLVNFDITMRSTPSRLDRRRRRQPFGTLTFGGVNGRGTVFEIVKTASGYASTPTG